MSSGIVAIDASGALVMLNAGAQRILGCPDGPVSGAIGRPCPEALEGQPAVARLLLDTLDDRAAQSRAELVLEGTDNGLENTIGFTLTPVRDPAGAVRGAAMIFRDLTPSEQMDEQQRLHERLAALGQMAAGLAHEIRNPLAGMEVVGGLLKRRLKERPEDSALVEQLIGEVRTLADTVTRCLEFVRPVSPERGSVHPVEVLEDALATALSRCDFRGRVQCAFDDAIPNFRVDVNLFKAVLTNLIVNAFEAMAEDSACAQPTLELGVTQQAEDLVITVSDNGPGIPDELREKIFYPFFTTKQTGSGVGLANAQKVVVSHGGRLEAESRSGPGCLMRLHMPLGGSADGGDKP
jgi:signal transduction histidine kinase